MVSKICAILKAEVIRTNLIKEGPQSLIALHSIDWLYTFLQTHKKILRRVVDFYVPLSVLTPTSLIHLSGDIGGAQFCFHARIFNG